MLEHGYEKVCLYNIIAPLYWGNIDLTLSQDEVYSSMLHFGGGWWWLQAPS